MAAPTTPDGRYFVIDGVLWRCSNPSLAEPERQRLVNELMTARRAVKAAKGRVDAEALREARAGVQAAKAAPAVVRPISFKASRRFIFCMVPPQTI